MKSRATEINAELKRLGHAERLRRGNGYYYFSEGETARWYDRSVMVYRAYELSVEQWMHEYDVLKNNFRNGGVQ
jgi:hypothetical protein